MEDSNMIFKNIEWKLSENTDDYIIYTYRLDLGIISYLFNYGVCYGKYFVECLNDYEFNNKYKNIKSLDQAKEICEDKIINIIMNNVLALSEIIEYEK